MRCLITGGAGFIGSHLVDEAVHKGYQVVVLDDLSTGRLENLAGLLDKVEFVLGDVRDRDLTDECARGADYIFHHAAMAAVPLSVRDPWKSAQVNDLGTLNIFLAAIKNNVKKVVYASSSAIYGEIDQCPHREDMSPDPNNPYAAHKLLGEHYAQMFKKLYGLDVVSLRYFNVFGPRQDPSSPYSGVISVFMDRIRRGVKPVVFGDGRQSRDFIHVRDVVSANFMAAESNSAGGQVYNVGTGSEITLMELLDYLEMITGYRVSPRFEAAQPGDVYKSRADVTKISSELGFRPLVPFGSGLADTWSWFMGEVHGDQAGQFSIACA